MRFLIASITLVCCAIGDAEPPRDVSLFGGDTSESANAASLNSPPGVSRTSKRAYAAALHWIYRHQRDDGSWSFNHTTCCKEKKCEDAGNINSRACATAIAILPFLAAGMTHETKSPYQRNVAKGIDWLVDHQVDSEWNLDRKQNHGDLSGGDDLPILSHCVATYALSETYCMTKDFRLRARVQSAIKFIEQSQYADGGWRKSRADKSGDLPTFCAATLALRSAQLGGIDVSVQKLELARGWLNACRHGPDLGLFSGSPMEPNDPSFTAYGFLAARSLQLKLNDASIAENVADILKRVPDATTPDAANACAASFVLYSRPFSDWKAWRDKVRKTLVDTQVREGCSTGSWNAANDAHGADGGRLMTTVFSCLALEVYHGNLPVFKSEKN